MKTIELLTQLELSKPWICKILDISRPTLNKLIDWADPQPSIEKRINTNFKRLIEDMEKAHYDDVL